MDTPINDIINKNKEHISFHTPAHSGVGFFKDEYLKRDITELSFSDNLLCPTGVIKKSQQQAAKVYKSRQTAYVTNGATGAMHTVINAFRKKTLLIAGHCHRSVFSAVRLFGVKAFYSPSTINLDANIRKCKADIVILTSPDYFGNVTNFDIKEDVILVVDEAHGSHFVFSNLLPESMLTKADIVIHSLHKTLPALTGAALIHFRDEFKDIIYSSLNDTHTTSPSYLTLSSIEAAIAEYDMHGATIYKNILARIDEFSSKLSKRFWISDTDDKTRLVIKSNYQSDEVCNYLQQNGIFAELNYQNQIVFIVTHFNVEHLGRLRQILGDAPHFARYKENEEYALSESSLKLIEIYDEFELIPINRAENRLLYKEIGLYPPGVPLMFSGEVLTAQKLDFITRNQNRLFGLDNLGILVVK